MFKLLSFIFILGFSTNVFGAQKFEKILKVNDDGVIFLYVGNMFERKENLLEYKRFLSRTNFEIENLNTTCNNNEFKVKADTLANLYFLKGITPMHILHPKTRDILKRMTIEKSNTITEANVVRSVLTRFAVSEEHGEDQKPSFNCKKVFTSKNMFDTRDVQDFISSHVEKICSNLTELTSCLNRVNEKNEKLHDSIQRDVGKTKKYYVDEGDIFEPLDTRKSSAK